jgi:hypothetical protein
LEELKMQTDFPATPYEHTAFGGFWKAINLHLARLGQPELGFKDAREAWDAAVSVAGQCIREHAANRTTSVGIGSIVKAYAENDFTL